LCDSQKAAELVVRSCAGVVVESVRAVAAARPDRVALQAEKERLTREFQAHAAAGNLTAAFALKPRLDALEAALADGSDAADIPVSVVLESARENPRFLGSRATREPLRPLLAEFVKLGIHPTDPTGTKRIKLPSGESLAWESLFVIGEDGTPDWKDDAVEQDKLNAARQMLVSEMQRLVTGVVFSKTYFALEETGVAYPSVGSTVPARDRELADTFLRVFADSYRLVDSQYEDSMRTRVRRTHGGALSTSPRLSGPAAWRRRSGRPTR
jgi:hypothetical protein